METVAENGKRARKPRVSDRFSQGVENEWADAGQDGRICAIILNSPAQTGTGNIVSSLLSFPYTGLATIHMG